MSVISLEDARDVESVAVWSGAKRCVLSFGVGMTQISRKEPRIREAAARGLRIHMVMVDPDWILSSRAVSAMFDNYYSQVNFGQRFRDAHSRLSTIALDLNDRFGEERMRVHTYQSVVTQSATIADPGNDWAFGFLELHAYGRYTDRTRTRLPGPDGRDLLLAQRLRAISNLAGYDFTSDKPDDVWPSPSFAFAP